MVRICALCFTHPSAHTVVNTHRSEHTPGAVGMTVCVGIYIIYVYYAYVFVIIIKIETWALS